MRQCVMQHKMPTPEVKDDAAVTNYEPSVKDDTDMESRHRQCKASPVQSHTNSDKRRSTSCESRPPILSRRGRLILDTGASSFVPLCDTRLPLLQRSSSITRLVLRVAVIPEARLSR